MTRESESAATEAPEFEVRTESTDSAVLVRVTGELDLSTHEQLRDALVGVPDADASVVVDLSECKFIDSSGIRALLVGYEAIRSSDGGARRVAVAGAQPQVRRVLEMTGVDDAIPVHDSVDTALASV
jgi:anti-anti-sigma factor